MILPSSATDSVRPSQDPPNVLIIGSASRLRRALTRRGHRVAMVRLEEALEHIDERVEAVVIDARAPEALVLAQRLKTRFQVPLLPVVILRPRPHRTVGSIAPDA